MRTNLKPSIAKFAGIALTAAGVLSGFNRTAVAEARVAISPMTAAPLLAPTPSQLAGLPWGATAPKSTFQAPIKRRIGGIPVIDVTFNRSRKFEMIVDTGASGTLITRPMASALQVPIVGSVRSGIADGSVVVFPIGRVNSISVDGAEVKDVEVAIADRMDIGLLGHDFFGNYDMKIKRDVVEFYRRTGK